MLQNLLSDEECSGTEDVESTAAFNSGHFERASMADEVHQVTPRKKRVR